MTLRLRFGVWAAVFSALVVTLFGGLVYLGHARQLERQLTDVLLQDLVRVATLLATPTLGSSFVAPEATGFALQLVTAEGRVMLAWGDSVPLPELVRPARVVHDGRTYLAAQSPWPAARGSVRLAHDVSAALAAVAGVGRTLLVTGFMVVLTAALLALIGVRRMLWPLTDLARQTRAVDPAAPGTVCYRGPRDEIHDLAAGLNEALQAIALRHDAEHALLLEVAHELAAPLMLVHYHLDDLRKRDPEDARLRAASDAARELLRTSQDLLVVARGELERPIVHHLLDLREIVRRVAAEYPEVRVVQGGEAEAVGDPERLIQVVRNVVRNAVQAAGASGVTVSVRSEGGDQVVEVRDVGPGMSEEARSRAFERGFSGGRGSGVGLSVARTLIERQGGSIAVVSSTDAGTVMEIRLPSLASRLAPSPPFAEAS